MTVRSIRPGLNTPHELVQDLIELMPQITGVISIVAFKDETCRCAFSNMELKDILFLQRVLDVEIDRRMACSFIPDPQ